MITSFHICDLIISPSHMKYNSSEITVMDQYGVCPLVLVY